MKPLNIFITLLFISTSLHAQQIKALVGGTLIDGFGGKPIRNSVVIVQGKKILKVGTVNDTPIPAGAEVISTEGMSVLPGLWESHAHLQLNGHADYEHWRPTYLRIFGSVIMPSSAHQLLMAGVTSARDLGGPLKESLEVRDRINRGEIPGPTLYVSGPFIQHTTNPSVEFYRWGVNGPDDARKKVKKLADAGVDVIKFIDHDLMTMEEAKAAVEEAHRNGLPVVAHAHRPDEIRRGLQLGVDNFEHTGLSSAPRYPDDIMDLLAERTAKMNIGPLYWTPTVEGLYNYEYLRDNPEGLDNDSWHLGLPDSVITDIRDSFKHPDRLPYFQLTPIRKPTLEKKFNQLQEAGVVMLIGTDSGIPMKFHSQSTWKEFDVWVNEFGYDPMLAIKAATYWPSKMMKVDDEYGTVSEGKYADIIAVKGDVLRYISLLSNVQFVMKHGEVVKNEK
ncbi:MAG: amidohydrolase family protein [Cyclobacteriaceae bacterium]